MTGAARGPLLTAGVGLACVLIGGGWLWSAVIAPLPGLRIATTRSAGPAPVLETIAPARDVTPPGTLPWPIPEGPVERLPADLPPAPPPKPPSPLGIGRVVVRDARTLVAGTQLIRLKDIETQAPDARCTDPEGFDWPCGQAAITELRMLIRGRAVHCAPLPDGANENAPRRCSIGPIDLGEWMLRQGWGKPAAGAPSAYALAHEAARDDQRGEFGRAWGR